jgi:putative tricarboxylic transport membrane protein
MSEQSPHADENGPSQRAVEVGTALFTLTLGVIILIGSLQANIGWSFEGPQAGFFPFYISLFIILASVINLVQVGKINVIAGRRFATWEELRRVMSVVIPTAIYVVLVPNLGIYVSSMLLIAVFMAWLGGYGWKMTLPLALGIPALAYLVFERWFMIPLPKGPIEYWLGF